jgi:ABC-type glycerol-3-phosphate transport system substrate-binding protein
MKKKFLMVLLLAGVLLLSGCGGVKVVDAWRSPDASEMRNNNILVIARTANKKARIAFEREIADLLIENGMKATASFSRFPKLDPDAEMTEERKNLIRFILDSEGYDGVVLSVIKDVRERTVTSYDAGSYFGGPWDHYYPSYFGGFYGYYYHPYVYSYTVSVGNEPVRYTTRTYYLETVAYNLRSPENAQLVAVVTSTLEDPKDAYKTAEKYAKEIANALKK